MPQLLVTVLFVLLFTKDGNCKTVTRIHNGYPNSQNLYPYVLGIEALVSHKYMAYCCGTLIKENWILTAGDCVRQQFTLTVVYGNRSKENDTERLKVIYQTRHPFSNLDTAYHNDLGLMKVAKNPNITLAKLSSTDYGESFGLAVVYAGYGTGEKTKYSFYKIPKIILSNSRPLVVADGFITDCIREEEFSLVSPRMCFFSNRTFADGIIGGPLIYQDSVIAVASPIYKGINRYQKYFVFVPVIYYLHWIQEEIEANQHQAHINTKTFV